MAIDETGIWQNDPNYRPTGSNYIRGYFNLRPFGGAPNQEIHFLNQTQENNFRNNNFRLLGTVREGDPFAGGRIYERYNGKLLTTEAGGDPGPGNFTGAPVSDALRRIVLSTRNLPDNGSYRVFSSPRVDEFYIQNAATGDGQMYKLEREFGAVLPDQLVLLPQPPRPPQPPYPVVAPQPVFIAPENPGVAQVSHDLQLIGGDDNNEHMRAFPTPHLNNFFPSSYPHIYEPNEANQGGDEGPMANVGHAEPLHVTQTLPKAVPMHVGNLPEKKAEVVHVGEALPKIKQKPKLRSPKVPKLERVKKPQREKVEVEKAVLERPTIERERVEKAEKKEESKTPQININLAEKHGGQPEITKNAAPEPIKKTKDFSDLERLAKILLLLQPHEKRVAAPQIPIILKTLGEAAKSEKGVEQTHLIQIPDIDRLTKMIEETQVALKKEPAPEKTEEPTTLVELPNKEVVEPKNKIVQVLEEMKEILQKEKEKAKEETTNLVEIPTSYVELPQPQTTIIPIMQQMAPEIKLAQPDTYIPLPEPVKTVEFPQQEKVNYLELPQRKKINYVELPKETTEEEEINVIKLPDAEGSKGVKEKKKVNLIELPQEKEEEVDENEVNIVELPKQEKVKKEEKVNLVELPQEKKEEVREEKKVSVVELPKEQPVVDKGKQAEEKEKHEIIEEYTYIPLQEKKRIVEEYAPKKEEVEIYKKEKRSKEETEMSRPVLPTRLPPRPMMGYVGMPMPMPIPMPMPMPIMQPQQPIIINQGMDESEGKSSFWSNFFKVLLILLLLASIIGLGFLLWKNLQKTDDQNKNNNTNPGDKSDSGKDPGKETKPEKTDVITIKPDKPVDQGPIKTDEGQIAQPVCEDGKNLQLNVNAEKVSIGTDTGSLTSDAKNAINLENAGTHNKLIAADGTTIDTRRIEITGNQISARDWNGKLTDAKTYTGTIENGKAVINGKTYTIADESGKAYSSGSIDLASQTSYTRNSDGTLSTNFGDLQSDMHINKNNTYTLNTTTENGTVVASNTVDDISNNSTMQNILKNKLNDSSLTKGEYNRIMDALDDGKLNNSYLRAVSNTSHISLDNNHAVGNSTGV